MRAAGCTYNDIVDRNIDGKVERTRLRPIPSGQVSVKQAAIFLAVLCLIGLCVLLQFNRFTILLGAASMIPVAIYPFMKRFISWPQAVLGIAFNWGALLGWTAMTGSLGLPAILLYLGAVTWTIGYDTIYAHQDKQDDAVLGLKSTALTFGEKTVPYLYLFYAITWLAIFTAGMLSCQRLYYQRTQAASQPSWPLPPCSSSGR